MLASRLAGQGTHLLPANQLAAWIQANLNLSLADAPFDREDPTLNLATEACVTCPPPQRSQQVLILRRAGRPRFKLLLQQG